MNLCLKCKECGEEYPAAKNLHAHIKAHGLTKPEYYVKHFPRFNKLTKQPIDFKSEEQYFFQDFSDYKQMIDWLEVNHAAGKSYCVEKLSQKKQQKDLKFAPSHVYCLLADIPNPIVCKKYWNTYSEMCDSAGLPLLYDKGLTWEKLNEGQESKTILIDTREQKPFEYPNARTQKLHVGDYTLEGDEHCGVFVDRKAEEDFKSTFTLGYERFRRELDLCKSTDGYMVVLVESFIEEIIATNGFYGKHKVNLTFLWHNVRQILLDYPENIQFVFAGNRAGAKFLLPKLLNLKNKIRKIDIQPIIDLKRKPYCWIGT